MSSVGVGAFFALADEFFDDWVTGEGLEMGLYKSLPLRGICSDDNAEDVFKGHF